MYTPMFGEAIQSEVEELLKKVCIARLYVQQEIEALTRELPEQNRGLNYFKRLFLSIFDEISPSQMKLFEQQKIPDILDTCVQTLCIMFEVGKLFYLYCD